MVLVRKNMVSKFDISPTVWSRAFVTWAAMVLVIGSFCRYMLSIYEYERYDTFGQCFIAINFANHEVSKARSSIFSLFINHDRYCLATLYSGYSPKINLLCSFLVPYSYKIFSSFWWILMVSKRSRGSPMVDSTVPILGFRDFMIRQI